ncbi:MAG: hypothetical protein DRP68_03690 [Candidatus Omnitrophota bacterium]|nr:MAG: hypothetical protein DRP68_03690 [Candidatus Omnitrophota bacterium]RKY46024.1 MAG: hypothetical protein DRP81_01940 [Candidatus Omnitrophota bacterium]
MHEYHLAKSVLNSVLEKAKNFPGVVSISSIRLKIGNLKMVSSQSFREAFFQLTQGTLCEKPLFI